jgi:hypothetical protein
MDLVLRDFDGDAWVYIGNGMYVQPHEIQKGRSYVLSNSDTRETIEKDFGPVTVEWSEDENPAVHVAPKSFRVTP